MLIKRPLYGLCYTRDRVIIISVEESRYEDFKNNFIVKEHCKEIANTFGIHNTMKEYLIL